MTGKRPEYVFSDVRDPDKAGIINAEDASPPGVPSVRLFNRKWLEGMMKERLFAWRTISGSSRPTASAPGSDAARERGERELNEMKQILVDDKLNLNLPEWMERNNPYAHRTSGGDAGGDPQGILAGDAQTLQDVAVAYAEASPRYGLSGHV